MDSESKKFFKSNYIKALVSLLRNILLHFEDVYLTQLKKLNKNKLCKIFQIIIIS